MTTNFGTPSTKNFFALIRKIFLQTLVEIIFRSHNIFFRVLGPPGAPLRTKWKFLHVRSWVSKYCKKGALSSSEGILGKYSKMKVLVLNFGTPSAKFFFSLTKKIFLQPLVEIIFRYHKIFLGFWDPLGPPYEQNKKFLHVRSWVSK